MNEAWRAELNQVVDLMRELSTQSDPQQAARLYGNAVREKFIKSDRWVAVSRRGLEAPAYRITRSSRWSQDIDPWKQKDQLPLYTSGLLGELIYADVPVIINDLAHRLAPDDPAYDELVGMDMLLTVPQYDGGVALNMNCVLVKDRATLPLDKWPMMVWQANLFGRATLNLVLRQELKRAYDRLDHELKVVGDIQRSLLPSQMPPIAGLQMSAHYQTSARAGGDYYDFFPLPNGTWGMLLADVSGHGTPAAVVMAITHTLAHAPVQPPEPPGKMLAYLNTKLSNDYAEKTGGFVTAIYATYNPSTRELSYANAGHPPPRLRHPDGRVEGLLGETHLPLGIEADEPYTERKTTLQTGQSIVLYTDGITEASAPGGELYGTDRLDAVLRQCDHSADAVRDAVLADVQSYTHDQPPSDDRTLLVVRCV